MEGTLTCTACQVPLATQEEYKLHYKSDFHVYNLKRKTVNLPPVALEVYREKKLESETLTNTSSAGTCQVCGTTYASASAFQHHLRSKKHNDANVVREPHVVKNAGETEPMNPLTTCFFCNSPFPSIDTSLQHMLSSHGFFLPDVQQIIDLESLLKYLFEKVHVGNMCLYCNNKKAHAFASAAAVQQHMVDKQHCFLNIDEDVEEFKPFYAFSDEEEDGESDEEEENEESKAGGEEGESGSVSAVSSHVSVPRVRKIPAEVMSTGELKLTSGKILGHKDFTRYYKQRYRGSYIRHQEVLALMSDAYQSQVQTRTSWTLPEALRVLKVNQDLKKERELRDGVLGNSLQKHYRKSHP